MGNEPVEKTTPIVQSTIIVTTNEANNQDLGEQYLDMEIGNELVQAIDAYYLDKNVYPNNLLDLVPKYISEIPHTTEEQEYKYTLFSEGHPGWPYQLVFMSSNGKAGCSYQARNQRWECGFYTDH